ncbi:outer membrane protein [Pararhizobium polonicum]|uniref:outer membrane protein n=1 Tax=Pararhizobium polonicum TaxID=1612624 RepID=UPI00111298C3|nr:outer membrane beta-barrel protein [Pararhizobium polonicum]
MKRNIFCTAIATVLMLGLRPAVAGDMFAPSATAPIWSGCYVGANTGYGRVNADAIDSPFREGPFAGPSNVWNQLNETIGMDGNGLTGGVEAGCDRQFDIGGNAFVLGGVIDFSLMNFGETGTSASAADTHTSFDLDWAASARLRAGVAASDMLFYVTGGVAFADINVRAYDRSALPPTPGVMDVSGGGTETGWVAGGGVEWRFKPNWSVGLEYLHYDFGTVTATGAAIDPVGAFPRYENDINADVIRIGLKWRM